MNTTGKNIRTLRQKANLSQGQVAKKLGISIPAFSKIETGITDINLSRLTQISTLFSVHPISIITADGENPEAVYREHVTILKDELALKDVEIIKLQSKLINLYSEARGE